MKFLILLIVFTTFDVMTSFSQEIKFNQFSDNYNYLMEADYPVTKSIKWRDDQSFTVPIPFIFKFGGVESEFINIHTNGYSSYYLTTTDDNITVFAFWILDLIDRSYKTGSLIPQSIISSKTITVNNEKIAIVEYKNAGFEYGGINDSLNFQIWAFESGNKIQIRFGKSYVQNWQPIFAIDSPAVCILTQKNETYLGGCLNGSTTNPTFDTVSGRFNAVPSEGTVYEFTYLTTNINLDKKNSFNYKLYDNTLQIITIDNEVVKKVDIIDLVGRELKSSNNNNLDISNINNGIYLLKVTTESGFLIKKIKL